MSKDYPQPDRYFKIANDLAENFAKLNLSPYEWRVLWAFLRLSYGYKGKEMKFSMAKVIEISDLDKRNAYRSYNSLINKGLIKNLNPHPMVNKRLSDWKTFKGSGGVSVETLNPSVSRDTNIVSTETPRGVSVETDPIYIKTNIKTERQKTPSIPYEEIIGVLNKKTGKNFRYATAKYQACIRARWNEGYRMLDFHKVITNRIEKWGGDPKMAEYLRPETLFGTKFQGYLNDYGAEYGIQPQATPREEIDGLYDK